MEILEIRSAYDLTAPMPAKRKPGPHSYRVNCRQFLSLHSSWQRHKTEPGPLALMTLSFERIWITEEESAQIAEAVKATRSPLTLLSSPPG